MRLTTRPRSRSRSWGPEVMRDELSHALVEALYELDVLPTNPEGAVVGIYAIMDDVRAAIDRTQQMDARRSA